MIITFGGLIGYATLSYVKENTYIGHSMSDLIDDEWITSEYGTASFTISTPKVLRRVGPIKKPDSIQSTVNAELFQYQSYLAPFAISLETLTFTKDIDITADKIAETILKQYEEAGTKDIIVKYDEYESPRGIKGLKMYGSATFSDVENPLGTSQKRAYAVYVFEEGVGIQILRFMYEEDDEEGKKVLERVMNSIAQIEVQK
jgi:hypothetical protein